MIDWDESVINNFYFMSIGESFLGSANGTNEADGSQTHPELYSLQKEAHDNGVAAFKAALDAAFAVRVNQLEAGGSTSEEAREGAQQQFDEACEKFQEERKGRE